MAVLHPVPDRNIADVWNEGTFLYAIWNPVYADIPAGYVRGRFPGCIGSVLSGHRTGDKGNGTFYLAASAFDGSVGYGVFPYLGA